ncbi:MAG TPA: ligase-associated DNA damage response endonuclease PdeM [Candidatus Obscuribacter sp.]|nr:ligase-associated DNA damage response endonuclease PdeM [Candidatus Obscuribacter sp.]MBK9278101.1 ligase-associated DNA damage response endonuclease PdeM [Candidatus Obscuribacter sp.]HNG18359.1 ligase-associated DNA damage response endonuclease PdeM [Candidatus Obscuribacter sp.]
MAEFLNFKRQGETITVLPDKAVFLPSRKTLLVSDIHLGKGQAFRARQFFAPAGVCAADLQRLLQVVTAYKAERLIILGDLVHSRDGINEELDRLFLDFRAKTKNVETILVLGNHDLRVNFSSKWRLSLVNGGFEEDGFFFEHGDEDTKAQINENNKTNRSGLFRFSGHIHPAVRLHGAGKASERMPCFWLRSRERCLVLPSFGRLTGAFTVSPQTSDRVFIPLYDEGNILEVTLK